MTDGKFLDIHLSSGSVRDYIFEGSNVVFTGRDKVVKIGDTSCGQCLVLR